MTRLSLVLEDRSATQRTYVSAIVNIYDVTTGRAERQNKPNLVLDHNHLDVDLIPGKYIVELRLPAGNLIRKEVEIKDQLAQTEAFDLDSPHEWLWLQRSIGNVGSKSEYEARLEKAGSIGVWRDAPAPRPATWIVCSKTLAAGDYTINSAHLADQLGVAHLEIKEGYFMLHPELRRALYRERELGAPPLKIAPISTDRIMQFFELNPGQVKDLTFQDQYIDDYYRSDRFERRYFWTQLPKLPPQYSVLPIPWQNPDDGQLISVHINVTVDPSEKIVTKNHDTMHRIAVTVGDPYFSSLIGYLGSGELPSASVLLRQAQQVLFLKVNNPFAAAAGAYVLLEQTELDEHRPWHVWVRNLMNWYTWLPDGAIQWAWLQIAEKNMNATEDQIKKSLLEAYDRGLPYYTAGVKLLLNGLTVFDQRLKLHGAGDVQIATALNNVQLLASRVDRRQPFTSVIAD